MPAAGAPCPNSDVPGPARGRHRAPSRGGTRAIVAAAAVTTGTVAATSVAFAGSAGPAHTAVPTGDDQNVTTAPTPIQAASERASRDVRIPAPIKISETGLLLGPRQQTVRPRQRAELTAFLFDPATRAGLPDQRVRILRRTGYRWTTTGVLSTDRRGRATYRTSLLTTTHLTAIFDGTHSRKPTRAKENVVRVLAPPRPATFRRPAGSTTARASTVTGASRSARPAPGVTSVPASGLGQRAVYLASVQAGKPYSWGAAGPYGFDCSGLAQYVFKQLGRYLPHNTDAIYGAVEHVPQSAKQPGDLIFFGSPGGIYHMGIYAGNGMMWAAPHSGDVVKLASIWTTSYLVGRVL